MIANRSVPTAAVLPVLGGHVWTFSQSIADVDPASWGGVLR
jgi:hypothetical protein